jgi:cell division protein FtsW
MISRSHDVAGKKRKAPDFGILVCVILLLVVGLLILLSASSAFSFANTEDNDPYEFFFHQLQMAGIGLLFALVAMLIPYRIYRHFAVAAILLSLFTYVLLHVDYFAVTTNEATRWIGFGGFTFQPSEGAKLALALFLAYSFTRIPVRSLKGIAIPGFLVIVFTVLTMREPDLGSAVLLAAGCYVLFFLTELPLLALLAVVPLGVFAVAVKISNTDYQKDRITAWLNPWADPIDKGLQSVQAQIAFANGGVFGVGMGSSEQKFYLPESYTDAIFAIAGEELGFILTLLIVALYAALVFRCLRVAKNCSDYFGRYLVTGIAVMFGLQVIVNMGVIIGIFPVSGMTLPFMSYGGSSMIVTLTSFGMILSVSRN